jgi:hypothetical protein
MYRLLGEMPYRWDPYMVEAIRFFREYEVWIYVVAGAIAVWQVGKFILAWQELGKAAFGLERESAQYKLNKAAAWLVLMLLTVVGVFMVVSFVAPAVPGAIPIPTPTLDLLATPSITLPPPTPALSGTGQAAGTVQPEGTSQPAALPEQSACVAGQVMISEPKDGQEISDIATLKGTASIPNFGFYKYEVARPGDSSWLTLGGGRNPVVEDKLGDWDTTTRVPGEYLLRLVVTDNEGNYLPACVIRVRIAPSVTP